VVVTVSKKWLIIGGVAGATIAGVFGGLYLAGYMVRKSTEQIIKQIQTTLPPTTLSTPPTQPPTAPPPTTTQQLVQTQNQQQQQTERKLPKIQVGGFIPNPPPLPPTPPTTCTGTCPSGTIPMQPGIAHMAGCPVVTTVCGVVCVPNYGPCLQKANQIEAQLSIYTSPQYL
jgi:hypothetical protein